MPIIGGPARGDDLYGRRQLIDNLWDVLDQNNVLLVAPRRFGKTSVMHGLCDRPRDEWRPVYLDVEHVTRPPDFAIELLHASWKAQPSWRGALRQRFEGARSWFRAAASSLAVTTSPDTQFWLELRRDMAHEWEARSLELLQALRECRGRVVFVVDELGVMLEGFAGSRLSDEELRRSMRWFRRLRIDPEVGLTSCRFLLGSSIGIEGGLSRLGAVDTINDLQLVVLEELPGDDGCALLTRLLEAEGIAVSERTCRAAMALLGPAVPYFIQIMAQEMIDACRCGERLGPKSVQALYETRLMGVHCRTYFQHYYDRLRRLDPLDHRAALSVLDHLARAHRGPGEALWVAYTEATGRERSRDDFRQMLADLENDFYLRRDPATGEWVFWSNVLRDWWRRHYCD